MIYQERKSMGPAALECENKTKSCGLWAEHVFDHIEGRGSEEKPTYFHIYRCAYCGTHRVWGTSVSPYPIKDKEE